MTNKRKSKNHQSPPKLSDSEVTKYSTPSSEKVTVTNFDVMDAFGVNTSRRGASVSAPPLKGVLTHTSPVVSPFVSPSTSSVNLPYTGDIVDYQGSHEASGSLRGDVNIQAEAKGANAFEYGLIFGLYQVSRFLAAPGAGKLMGLIDAKILAYSGTFMVGVGILCFGLLDYVNQRLLFLLLAAFFRIVEGFGAASTATAAYAIMTAQFSDQMATGVAVIQSSTATGIILGQTLGGALYDLGGYGLPFYAVGCVLLFQTLILLLFLPSHKPQAKLTKGNSPGYWRDPGIILFTFTSFTGYHFAGYNSASLEPHLREFQLSGFHLGAIMSLSAVFYLGSISIWTYFCNKKCNRIILMTIGTTMMILCFLFIGPMPFLQLKKNVGLVTLSVILSGAGMGGKLIPSFVSCMEISIARGFPADISTYGFVSSMVSSFQSLGLFIGPTVGGLMLDEFGYNFEITVCFVVEILLLLLLLIYAAVLKRKAVKKKAEDKEKILAKDNDIEFYVLEKKEIKY